MYVKDFEKKGIFGNGKRQEFSIQVQEAISVKTFFCCLGLN